MNCLFICSEAHPEKFNSRIRNKMFYGQMGGKDLLQRKWKDLTEFVSLECDGKDYTPKIREHKFHALLFLNIPRLVTRRYLQSDENVTFFRNDSRGSFAWK